MGVTCSLSEKGETLHCDLPLEMFGEIGQFLCLHDAFGWVRSTKVNCRVGKHLIPHLTGMASEQANDFEMFVSDTGSLGERSGYPGKRIAAMLSPNECRFLGLDESPNRQLICTGNVMVKPMDPEYWTKNGERNPWTLLKGHSNDGCFLYNKQTDQSIPVPLGSLETATLINEHQIITRLWGGAEFTVYDIDEENNRVKHHELMDSEETQRMRRMYERHAAEMSDNNGVILTWHNREFTVIDPESEQVILHREADFKIHSAMINSQHDFIALTGVNESEDSIIQIYDVKADTFTLVGSLSQSVFFRKWVNSRLFLVSDEQPFEFTHHSDIKTMVIRRKILHLRSALDASKDIIIAEESANWRSNHEPFDPENMDNPEQILERMTDDIADDNLLWDGSTLWLLQFETCEQT